MNVASQPVGDDYTRRLVGVCMLVRLVAILVSIAGFVGQTLTLPVLGCFLLLSGSGLAVLLSPRVASFVADHPIILVADVLVALFVLAVLGVESPLVLATMSTAIVAGFLFSPLLAGLCAFVLVSGYLLVFALIPPQSVGFMLLVGVPALYIGLVAIGAAAGHAHRAQLAAARRENSAMLGVVAADERARLAREMHDSLGKTLHGIALGAGALPQMLECDPVAAAQLADGLADGARQAAREARELLVRMRADQPDRPLAEVLHGMCDTWSSETNVPCAFAADQAVDLSTNARYEVLAIVAEALENVRRHAEAGHVTVNLSGCRDGQVEVSVTDDGVGFEAHRESKRGHFGLVGMRERAKAAELRFDVRSTPGTGTTVRVSGPSVPETRRKVGVMPRETDTRDLEVSP
jgi:signal transduction histidine kinase